MPTSADVHLILRILHALQHSGPAAEVALLGVHAQQPQDDFVHALLGEHQRHFVHRVHVAGRDHRFHVHVAEQRDLFLHVVRQIALAAAQQHVGLDTERAQLLHAMLRGLGFQLLRRRDPGDQRHVHEDRIVAAHLMPHLADGFEKRQRFDVAHRAADFDDHHVHVGRHFARRGLDFVGDVRNHLHRFAQIIAAPLAMDDLLVDAAGGEIIALRQLGVREALVVAQIEIGLGAIVGDENFAVLKRAHGTRIHVQIRIELLQRHAQSAAFEQTPDGRRRNAFSER